MADDETIRIRVDAAQASAAVDAFQKEVRELEAELKTLNSTAGVTNAEINGTTRRLEEAKGKLEEASKAVRDNASAQEESGKETKGLSDKYVQLGLKVFGARQVLMSLGSAMKSVAQATGSYSGATKDAIDQVSNLASSVASLDLEGTAAALGQLTGQTIAWAQGINEVNVQLGNLADKDAAGEFAKILKAQNALVQGHANEVDALNNKATVLSREIALQQQSGEVQKFVRDAVQETLDAYGKAGAAVPQKLAEQAAALGIVSKAQAEAAESSAKLEEAGVKSAEERAKAEAAAAESIKKSLEEQRVAREAMLAQLDAEILAAEERLKKQTTGGTVVEEFLPEGAPEEVKALKDEMRSLENQPFLDSGQQQRVEELKNKIADAGSQILKTYGVWKATNEMADGTHEAFNAAWDAYIARLNKSEVQHQNVMDDLQRLEGGYDDLGGTVDDVGGSFEDIAEAAGDLGKEAKKGTDAAKEGLDGLKAGAKEALPVLLEIEAVLGRIKQAASEVEL